MDAPKGRYSVIEKDGRLVVIDNGTGTPLPSSIRPPPPERSRGLPSPSSPVGPAGPGVLDRAADFLVTLVAKERDRQGRAVIAWTWEQNGRKKRWDALLDPRQQRRLGRALLALMAPPLFLVLLTLAGGGPFFGFGLLLILPVALLGAVSLNRLYRETNDSGRHG
jgi:hypothetical protein